MITDQEIKFASEQRFTHDEMDYEQNIEANMNRIGFEEGAKWAMVASEQCVEYHSGYKVFKCATVCSGLPNCRLGLNSNKPPVGFMRLDYKSEIYPDPDSFIKERIKQIEILQAKIRELKGGI